jgi:Peptidase family S41
MKKYLILITILIVGKISKGQKISRTFYPSQLKEEISVLKEALTTLHPGLYRYNTKQQIEKLFNDLTNKTTKPLNEKEFYLLLAKFTEKIGCGHTYLNPLNMEENIPALYMPEKVLPFCFSVLDRKFIITHNLSSDTTLKKGTEITKINGFATSQIIDSLLQVSRADGKNAIGKKLTNIELTPEQVGKYNLTDIFLPLFFKPIKENFVIETKFIENKISTSKINGVSTAQRASLYKKRYGIVPKGENSLKVQMLNDSTCYFKIGTFSFFGEENPFTKIIDSLFLNLANNKKVKNLILDLRTNEGGSTDARNSLLKYILPKDFEAKEYQERPFYSFLEVPKKLIPFLNTWDDSFFDPKSDSIYKKNEFGFYEDQSVESKYNKNFEDFKINSNSFKDNIFLMTSPVNSSAAFEFAWVFKQYKAGKIVGEKTGGTKQGLNGGRFFFLRLPYSRIEIDLPFIYQSHIGQPDEGVLPDYNVTKTQKGIYFEQDTQLDFVLKLIDGKK